MTHYPDEFLAALGEWQRGWGEEASGRLRTTARLSTAISALQDAPAEIFQCSARCYRKRFLIPNNEQNGGDMMPLFFHGEIDEGFASWTTDFEFARFIFKKEARPGEVGAIFAVQPSPEDVVLNIAALWLRTDFMAAVESYRLRGGAESAALNNFKNKQSEVILKARLRLDDVTALCVQIPSLQNICAQLDIRDDEQVDAVWALMVQRNWFPTSALWSEGEKAQAQLDLTTEKIKAWLESNVPEIDRYRLKK
jgi:hypothetical protein